MTRPTPADVGLRPFTVSRVVNGEVVLLDIVAVNGPAAARLADAAKVAAETSRAA